MKHAAASEGSSGLDIKSVTDKLASAIAKCTSEEDLRVNMELALREAVPELPTPQVRKVGQDFEVQRSGGCGSSGACHRVREAPLHAATGEA